MEIQLINCPVCGNNCSSMAKSCPNCGHPFAESIASKVNKNIKGLSTHIKNQDKKSRRWMFATVIVGIIAVSTLTFAAYNFYYRNSLTIKVGIKSSSGGVLVSNPTTKYDNVRDATFYLSKKSFNSAMEEAHISSAVSPEQMWVTMAKIDKLGGSGKASLRFVNALAPYVISTAKTDNNGKASFYFSEKGNYYIIGMAQTTMGIAVWNVRVDTNQTPDVALDQYNAEYIDE